MLRYGDGAIDRIIGRLQINVGGANKYVKSAHFGDGTNRGVHFHQFTRGTLGAVGFNVGGIRLFRCRPSSSLGSYTADFGASLFELSSTRNAAGTTYQTDYLTELTDNAQYTLNGDAVSRVLVSVDGGAFWDELTWVGGESVYRKAGGLGGSGGWPDLAVGDPPASGTFSAVIAYAP